MLNLRRKWRMSNFEPEHAHAAARNAAHTGPQKKGGNKNRDDIVYAAKAPNNGTCMEYMRMGHPKTVSLWSSSSHLHSCLSPQVEKRLFAVSWHSSSPHPSQHLQNEILLEAFTHRNLKKNLFAANWSIFATSNDENLKTDGLVDRAP